MKPDILNHLDKNKVYKISFYKGITWNPLTLLGGAIRLIADIDYNHTGVLYFMYNNWYIQEAIDEGVKSDILENSNAWHYYTHYSIEEPDFYYVLDKVISRIFSIEGKPYDFKGLLFYQFYLNVFNKWIGRAARDGDKFYCYESVAFIFNIDKKKPKDINSKFIKIYEGKI